MLLKLPAGASGAHVTACRKELLRGPLYYGIILIGITLGFWRHHPAGFAAIALMCGGDGLADIAGRRFGRAKLPWNRNKSWVGSLAMFAGEGLSHFVRASMLMWDVCKASATPE